MLHLNNLLVSETCINHISSLWLKTVCVTHQNWSWIGVTFLLSYTSAQSLLQIYQSERSGICQISVKLFTWNKGVVKRLIYLSRRAIVKYWLKRGAHLRKLGHSLSNYLLIYSSIENQFIYFHIYLFYTMLEVIQIVENSFLMSLIQLVPY